jgi:hypothetical protein
MKRNSWFIILAVWLFTPSVFAIKDAEDIIPPFASVNPPPIKVSESPSVSPATTDPCEDMLVFPSEPGLSLRAAFYQDMILRQYRIGDRGNAVANLGYLLRDYLGEVQDAIRESHLPPEDQRYWRTILSAHNLNADSTEGDIRVYMKDLASLAAKLPPHAAPRINQFLGPVSDLAITANILNPEDIHTDERGPETLAFVTSTIAALRANNDLRESLKKVIPQSYGHDAETVEKTAIALNQLTGWMPSRINHLIEVLHCRMTAWLNFRNQVGGNINSRLREGDKFRELLIYIHEIDSYVRLAETKPKSP